MSLFRLRPEIDVEIETVEGKRTARVLLPGRTVTVPIEVVDAFFEPIAPSRDVPPPPQEPVRDVAEAATPAPPA